MLKNKDSLWHVLLCLLLYTLICVSGNIFVNRLLSHVYALKVVNLWDDTYGDLIWSGFEVKLGYRTGTQLSFDINFLFQLNSFCTLTY